MSTSTSPRSERAALLWGDRWWVEGRSEPIVFGEIARAAERLLAALAEERPARLRLIHQPDCLAAEAVDCPNGDRATLQAALGEHFPALFSEDRAWGFEPIVGGHGRCSTVLYHETEPALYPIAQAIEEAGIEVLGAWPLATLLNVLPDEWPETGALTVVGIAENRMLAFRHHPDGRREVVAHAGAESSGLALEIIQSALARPDIALQVAALDGSGESVLSRLPPLDIPRVRLAGWQNLAASAHTLSRRQPTQMLPLGRFLPPTMALMAAGVLIAVTALGFGADYVRVAVVQRQVSAANAAAISATQAEIAQRRQARAEFEALKQGVEAGAVDAPLFAPWLHSLAAALPKGAVLTSLHADRDGFAIGGGVTVHPAEKSWRDWVQTLIPPAAPWKLRTVPELPGTGFQIEATGRS